MAQEPNDRVTIREYLLGRLPDSQREAFERRLISDDTAVEELLVSEDELIDSYLKGELDAAQKGLFESIFLATSERQDKLRFGRAFMNYVSTQTAEKSIAQIGPGAPRWWTQLLPTPLRVAAYALVVVGVALATWQLFLRESDVDKGLIALNAAYREHRPLEARISKFDYAPYSVTRGPGTDRINESELRRAELTLVTALANESSPAVHHALGKVYLSQKKFDQAINQFEEALKGAPDDAQVYADLGAALLEKGRAERVNDPDNSASYFPRSLGYLNRALELNESLLEARFNRALLHRDMMLPRQAEEDWKKYLEKDPSSPWAVEARRNLQLISQTRVEPATPAQLLNDFIAAFQGHDDEQAWRILSHNKEMISGKFIPQQIAIGYLKQSSEARPEQAKKFLQALFYAGRLEVEKARDPYVLDMSAFYASSSAEQRALLGQAQHAVIAGYSLCEKSRFDEALQEFNKAKELFERAGDEWESRLLDYWVGYCLNQKDKIAESTALLRSLADYCERNNYKWLLGHANCWLGINYAESGDHSNSIKYYNRALAVVEEIDDNYNHQKVLSQLASQYNQVGQPERALSYNWRSLQLADVAHPGVRQLWRNYLYIARTFIAMKFYDAAEAFCDEMLHVALNDVQEGDMIQYSYHYLGQLYGGLRRYDEALRLTSKSIAIAQSLKGKSASRKQAAYSLLQLAHIKRQAGHHAQALSDYDQVIQIFEEMELGAYKYDALKGRLLSHVGLKNDHQVEAELPVVLKQFEDYRLRIREEQNLNSFFDRENDVYDTAINHAYMKGDMVRALAYSEISRARSLLATLRNAAPPAEFRRGQSRSSSGTEPMGLTEMRMLMPRDVQVLQYAVLNDKTLIWLITRESVASEMSDLPEAELRTKILTYVERISRAPAGARDELKPLARELYDALVGPVAGRLDPQKVVCIIPDKVISLLPFSALVSSPSGEYLISKFSLISSPSLNVFISCSEAARGKTNKGIEMLISIGNPSFSSEDFPGLPDLPAAGREAIGIAKYYAAREFVGPNAVREKIQPELLNADVIHFAGHYLANDRNPMLSRLVLARRRVPAGSDDGSLTVGEIVGRKLARAKLVVLSACQTGGGKYYNGEGVISISRTFLVTGIPLVVASQWAVDSEATAELMLKFHHYRSREGGLTTVAALRKAQLEMLSQEGDFYSDPYYWAAFLPIGGHADF